MQPASSTSLLNLYDLPRTALGELLAGWGFSAFHRDALWEALYRQQVESLDALEGLLRPDLLKLLRERACLRRHAVHHETFSSDGYHPQAAAAPARWADHRDGADAFQGPRHGVHQHAGRLRHGLRLLRHRADGASCAT